LYRKFYIKKRNGKLREILHPSKELKIIQIWLVKNIFDEFPVSEYSYAYSKGNSIKNNAKEHCYSNYIFQADISNFFPSIDRAKLETYFDENKFIVDKLGLTDEDIDFILDVCLYKGEYLVVGSCASPCISNLIMYKFDNELNKKLLKEGKYIYTRYADDIAISSKNYISVTIRDIVESELKKMGFSINNQKTHFSNKKSRRRITGVVLDNNSCKMTIGNKKYKGFQRKLYNYLVKGEGDEGYIKGYLSFIKDLNIEQYKQLKKTYKRYDKKKKFFTD
jgi:Leucine-rich repeat (LRR) protein